MNIHCDYNISELISAKNDHEYIIIMCATPNEKLLLFSWSLKFFKV